MDGELWAARMSTSKRHHSLQPSQSALLDRHINLDDVDGDEDMRPDFSCPYCYEDFDITSLCSHLEDEHFFESKAAICPVCAAKIGKDMVGHITLQHGHLFKIINSCMCEAGYRQVCGCAVWRGSFRVSFTRFAKNISFTMQRRRRFRRAGAPSSATLSLLGKELREAHLQALLGGGTSRVGALTTNSADPLLSNLVYSLPIPEAEDPPKPSVTADDTLSKPSTSIHQPKPSVDPSLTAEEREQKLQQAALRAKFVQQLVLSTLLGDS